ncbi:GntR family transcriptional regulator [Coraliomargarita sp. SDUM461003]|uniref:GntR family transcriptional regulator n=1 Tax=Thalassobacterium maritimum TaxID=3041265 RepID=A0ABU1AUL3_9BACT|nr:GntR family transcriptional regulator [Coraliomargarita sp. SDUM461003]MDQ8207856.1 GntR family transcriptional regulator [Coraliomargarita sp. SDUM461003]
MLPFEVQHQPGKPVSEQLVYAVKKAVAQGRLRPGDAFPSVRTLSREMRINPNTAQKAVSQLTQAGILEIQPGIGTRVREQAVISQDEMAALMEKPLEALVVEAKRLGLSEGQLVARLRSTWKNLNR